MKKKRRRKRHTDCEWQSTLVSLGCFFLEMDTYLNKRLTLHSAKTFKRVNAVKMYTLRVWHFSTTINFPESSSSSSSTVRAFQSVVMCVRCIMYYMRLCQHWVCKKNGWRKWRRAGRERKEKNNMRKILEWWQEWVLLEIICRKQFDIKTEENTRG